MNKDSSYHWQACSCGYTTAKVAHNFTKHQDQSGTWDECTDCSYKVLACAHDGEVVYKTANESNHSIVCQKCDCVLETAPHSVEISINETAHQKICTLCDYKEAAQSHDLTQECDESKHWSTCSCGYATEHVDHTLVKDHNDQQHWEKCNACTYKTNAINHSFGAWEIIEEASEDKDGIKSHTCIACDYTETATFSISDHVHVYVFEVIPPSCIAMGYTTYVCKCGDTYVDHLTDMVDHLSGGVWLYDETNHWSVCSECQEIINFAEHEKSQWITDLEAGVGVEGKKHIECLACKIVLENGTIDPISPDENGDNNPSSGSDIGYIFNKMFDSIDAFLSKIFTSNGNTFFSEHKYASGAIAGGAVILLLSLIFRRKRRK